MSSVIGEPASAEDVVDTLHDGTEDILDGSEEVPEVVEELGVGGSGHEGEEDKAGEAEGQLHAAAVYRILSSADNAGAPMCTSVGAPLPTPHHLAPPPLPNHHN